METTIAHYAGMSGKVLYRHGTNLVVWNHSTARVCTWPADACQIVTITSGPEGDRVTTGDK